VAGGAVEGEKNGGEVEMGLVADVGEGMVAATAVVDAEALEDADGGGLLERDLADGLGRVRRGGEGGGLE
jgi:hypothetical protein